MPSRPPRPWRVLAFELPNRRSSKLDPLTFSICASESVPSPIASPVARLTITPTWEFVAKKLE
jgi:hypothetical protein